LKVYQKACYFRRRYYFDQEWGFSMEMENIVGKKLKFQIKNEDDKLLSD
jgi:hypothetical protein